MILGGNARVTLGIVRALGRLGIPVMAGAEGLGGAGGLSRYCSRWFTYPPWGAGLQTTHTAIIDRVRQWRPAAGVEFRWLLFGELLHLAQTREKGRTIRALLSRDQVATNVTVTDPLPHLVEGLTLASRLVRPRR